MLERRFGNVVSLKQPQTMDSLLEELEVEQNRIPPKPKLLVADPHGFETFEQRNLRPQTLQTFALINRVIDEYEAKDFTLTLRQLFYQFVSRGWINNTKREYKKLGDAVSAGRLNGKISWLAIEDRTRCVEGDYDDDERPKVSVDYLRHPWRNQYYRPEVWIEKDALVGVISRVCNRYQVPYFSCRGFASDPMVYGGAKRFQDYLNQDLTPIVLHLADHDPSGINMTVDIKRRLWRYTQSKIEVRRIALNEEQTSGLPPNLVKTDDSRSNAYKEDYGDDCWELDALDPTVIEDLVEAEIKTLIDRETWNADKAKLAAAQEKLLKLQDEWQEIVDGMEIEA